MLVAPTQIQRPMKHPHVTFVAVALLANSALAHGRNATLTRKPPNTP
jgi:hypothetical protein